MYEKVGGKTAVADPEAEEIINSYRQRRGIVKRKITPQVNHRIQAPQPLNIAEH